jgi:hypothetical protein
VKSRKELSLGKKVFQNTQLTNGLNKLECYIAIGWLGWDKHPSLLDPFVSYEKMKCCEYDPGPLSKDDSNKRKF